MTTSKAKDFDCVEFKRRAQVRIYEEIKGMSPEEEIAYFRKAAARGPLGRWWKAIRQQQPRASRTRKGTGAGWRRS